MRRVILTIIGTIAGLAALLSFKSHEPSAVTSAGGATEPGATQAAGTPKPLATGEHAIDGNVADTIYGPVQIQVVVKNARIVGVNVLEQPSGTSQDLQIGQFAFPQLISETISAQSANVDAVSGASYTSAGYIKSLQSALDNGA
ncbi:MAG TPA: FMN-binding protein [Streptosporangiaceae bacterium]|jgi:uncharacterized protein with FMN-binding domain|nr:FMN-binding protein [Streptosporangiaceae bacterium]